MKATSEVKQEALEYYRENAFGYSSVSEYVNIDYGYCMSEAERKKVIAYIKENI